ncbi:MULTISPECIES: hypothetical protein [unclassified Ensifer]|uniref:hypothetical protein n=1 Tax=unclassified Ensifer TaxID=2633371 RepID=UPI0008135BF7|nr:MULTISPECIES: hypothetical protein [unclassified Ensifer]OCP21980.1 hypothetical protein BC361_25775 [Ensifer sp. LC54]OCP23240.1 hypothetical protein BC363_24990 [Ensifer sp. LC384]
MHEPHIATAPSWPVTIHIAGDYLDARRVCREFCDKVGLCVTVHSVDYVYTGDTERGVRVGLINYPRFPKTPGQIEEQAYFLAMMLRERLGQESFSIETPQETTWFSWREQDVRK